MYSARGFSPGIYPVCFPHVPCTRESHPVFIKHCHSCPLPSATVDLNKTSLPAVTLSTNASTVYYCRNCWQLINFHIIAKLNWQNWQKMARKSTSCLSLIIYLNFYSSRATAYSEMGSFDIYLASTHENLNSFSLWVCCDPFWANNL